MPRERHNESHGSDGLQDRRLLLYLACMAAVNVVAIGLLSGRMLQGYSDFASLYTAGKIIQRGEGTRLYDRQLQWQIQQEFSAGVTIRKGPLLYFHPPFEALALSPFALAPFPAAVLTWLAINLAMLATLLWLVRGSPSEHPLPLVCGGLMSLAFFPVAVDLVQGQDSLIVGLGLVLAYRSLCKKAEFAAGAWLGLGLVKFHLVAPLALVFLLRRKWRSFAGFCAVSLGLLIISVAVIGWRGVLAYPSYLGVGVVAPELMPNLRGILTAWFGSAPAWPAIPAFLACAIAGAWIWRAELNDPTTICAGLSFTVCVTLCGGYYAYSHDMSLLLIPLLGLTGSALAGSKLGGWPRSLFLASAALLWLSPLLWFLLLRKTYFSRVAFCLEVLLAISLAGIVRERQQSSDPPLAS